MQRLVFCPVHRQMIFVPPFDVRLCGHIRTSQVGAARPSMRRRKLVRSCWAIRLPRPLRMFGLAPRFRLQALLRGLGTLRVHAGMNQADLAPRQLLTRGVAATPSIRGAVRRHWIRGAARRPSVRGMARPQERMRALMVWHLAAAAARCRRLARHRCRRLPAARSQLRGRRSRRSVARGERSPHHRRMPLFGRGPCEGSGRDRA